MSLKNRSFLKLLDYTPAEIEELLDLAADLKAKKKAGIRHNDQLAGKNIAPHDLYDSPLPHRTHALIRDLGISRLRRIAHGACDLLDTPIEDLI